MDKSKIFKLGGLLGFLTAVGYGVYKKKKMTIEIEPVQEPIDILPEESQEGTSQK